MEDRTNTPEEILDLVDENDVVIGEVKKSEANQNPKLIHREVAVIIFDDQNSVLLSQRSFFKKVDPGIWSISCAGHVTSGCTYEQMAHQELKEELGFDTELEFLSKNLDRTPSQTRFFSWFLGRFPGGEIVIEKSEVEQAKFFTRLEFEELKSKIHQDPRYAYVLDGILMIDRFFAGEFNKFKT